MCNGARNSWPRRHSPARVHYSLSNELDPTKAGESLESWLTEGKEQIPTSNTRRTEAHKPIHVPPTRPTFVWPVCKTSLVRPYRGGTCSSPHQNNVCHKVFFGRERRSGRRAHDQRCQKFLAPSVFFSRSPQALTNKLSPAEADKE